MGTRSYWLWRISEQTGANIRDVKAMHGYIKAKGLVCGELRNNDHLEAVAHYFGVKDAQDLPLEITLKTRKKRVSKTRKSKLTDEQIFELRQQGVKYEEIAKLAGVTKQAVSERMLKYKQLLKPHVNHQ